MTTSLPVERFIPRKKKRLALTQCGNNPDTFIRDTLSVLIKPDMEVYRNLEAEIFGNGELPHS